MTNNRKQKVSGNDAKRKFREALQRKNQRARHGEAHTNAQSRINGAHGPAAQKRTFRRKAV
jgi:hypothetical protein